MLSSSDPFSFQLIFKSLSRFANHGDADLGGFMLAFEKNVHIATVKMIDNGDVTREVYPYISHFNLQYTIMKYFYVLVGDPYVASIIAGILLFTAMSLIVALICKFAFDEFSFLSSLFVILCFALSREFTLRSFHIYWMPFRYFIPFVFMLMYYPIFCNRNKFFICYLITSILVFFNSLMGYEYITNVTFGAILPVIYYELSRNELWNMNVWKRVLLHCSYVFISSLLGFVLAIFLHIIKAWMFFDDLHKGIQSFLIPYMYSTVYSVGNIRGNYNISIFSFLKSFLSTSIRNNMVFITMFIFIMPFLFSYKHVKTKVFKSLSNMELAWILISFISLFGSISWFLVIKHSIVHSHINWIIFYMYFIPCFAICVAIILQKTIKCCPNEQE
jgi:hypothetical protein